MSEIKPVAWIKDTSIVALKRDETTVLAYPYDYLIRPAVPLYTADAIAAAREEGRMEGLVQAAQCALSMQTLGEHVIPTSLGPKCYQNRLLVEVAKEIRALEKKP